MDQQSATMISEIRTPGIPDDFFAAYNNVGYGNLAAAGALGAMGAAAALGASGGLAAGGALGAIGVLATGGLGAAAAGAVLGTAALGAGAAMAPLALGAGAAMGTIAAKQALANPLSVLPGKMGIWARSGRYDYPAGGEIDFYNNRLCFDEPCVYDPENTGDYSMEWLRRAAPMTDYPYPPVYHRLHLELPRPDRQMSLIPYGDVASMKGNCIAHKVHMGTGSPLLKEASMLGLIKDFI